jgi:hypothetical protein
MCKRMLNHHSMPGYYATTKEMTGKNTAPICMHTTTVQNANNVDLRVSILETELIFDSVERHRCVCLPAHVEQVQVAAASKL